MDEPLAERYQSTIMQVALCVRCLEPLPIEELLAAIDQADAVGPFFAPSAWIEKRQAMLEDRELLQAALPLKKLATRIAEARTQKRATLESR